MWFLSSPRDIPSLTSYKRGDNRVSWRRQPTESRSEIFPKLIDGSYGQINTGANDGLQKPSSKSPAVNCPSPVDDDLAPRRKPSMNGPPALPERRRRSRLRLFL